MSEDLMLGAVHDDTNGSSAEMDFLGESMEGQASTESNFEGEGLVPDSPLGYGDFSIPEGMVADEGMAQGFSGLAQEMGLTKGNAQKLVDFYAEAQAQQAKLYHETVQGWKNTVMSDSEMGGHRWADSQRYIAKARDMLGGDEFVTFVEDTGIGNHPALLRFCLRAGKLLSEDSSIEGSGSPSGGGRSAAEVLFGDMGLRK